MKSKILILQPIRTRLRKSARNIVGSKPVYIVMCNCKENGKQTRYTSRCPGQLNIILVFLFEIDFVEYLDSEREDALLFNVFLNFLAPTAPPSSCSGFNISKNAIQVIWDVVPRLERNGIIIGYSIHSDKTFNHPTFLVKIVPNTSPLTYFKHYNLTVTNTILASPRTFVRDWLIPYTDYSFQVAALTSKGEGPRCEHFVVRTEEEGEQNNC